MINITLDSADTHNHIVGDVSFSGSRDTVIKFFGDGGSIRIFANNCSLAGLEFYNYSRVWIVRGFHSDTIQFVDCNVITIKDCVIHRGNTGIRINQPENIARILIGGVKIHGCEHEGIYIGPHYITDTTVNSVTILNSVITDCGWDGLQIGNTKWFHVENCIIANNGKSDTYGQDQDFRINPNAQGRTVQCYIQKLQSDDFRTSN